MHLPTRANFQGAVIILGATGHPNLVTYRELLTEKPLRCDCAKPVKPNNENEFISESRTGDCVRVAT